jgi:alkylation response protein AidB-like acyl-CoA dehydrogenase
MDPSLSEAESMLRDTARRLAEHLSCSTVSEFETFDSPSAWKALVDPGFIGLRLPEHAGGGGSTTVDAALVVEALANRLVPVPYLGSALATELLIAADTPTETLERVCSGETRVTIGMTPDLSEVSTSAAGNVFAFDGSDADAVVVLSPDDLQLRALAPGGPHPGADLTRRVHLAEASVETDIGRLGRICSPEAKARFVARALSLVSADLVGVMSAALDVAVSYTSTRLQFGVPIGSFQAVQHLAADQLVSLEGARSMAEYAAWAADELDVDDALLAAHSAKAYASETGRTLCQAVIQMHGGMGITWDCLAHLYLKRALIDGLLFGDVARQLSEVTDIRQRSAA